MKNIVVRTAKSVWLLPTYFLNPRGMFARPIVAGMKERYEFVKTPLDGPLSPPEDGLKFENGAFNTGEKTVLIVGMAIHTDGIVLDTRSSTENGDSFLEDAIDWASKEYGLPSINELPFKKRYLSELNVTFDKPPVIFDRKLSTFQEEVSSVYGVVKGDKFGFAGFSFSTEQGIGVQSQLFRFEREINTGMDENRFFSSAQVPTGKHIKLLEMLEKATT